MIRVEDVIPASTAITPWGLIETNGMITRGEGYSRIRAIKAGEKTLLTPAYIVSYSSYSDSNYLGRMRRTLTESFPARALLVSAYDYVEDINLAENNDVISAIKKCGRINSP